MKHGSHRSHFQTKQFSFGANAAKLQPNVKSVWVILHKSLLKWH